MIYKTYLQSYYPMDNILKLNKNKRPTIVLGSSQIKQTIKETKQNYTSIKQFIPVGRSFTRYVRTPVCSLGISVTSRSKFPRHSVIRHGYVCLCAPSDSWLITTTDSCVLFFSINISNIH